MIPRIHIEPPMSLAESARWTTPEEQGVAAAFGSVRRRTEYLAWRAVVRRELGSATRIAYDAAGAPIVDLPGTFIGVAHCTGRIAVCLSDRRCAVDMEPENRCFRTSAPRFLSPEEQALSSDALLPAAVWCAKETLYKLSGRTGLNLLRDIRIEAVDFAAGNVTGRVLDDGPLRLNLFRRDGYLVVYRL